MRKCHLDLSLCLYGKQDSCIGEKLFFFWLKCIMLFSSLQCYKLICHLNMLAVALGAKLSRWIIKSSESRGVWVFVCVSLLFQHKVQGFKFSKIHLNSLLMLFSSLCPAFKIVNTFKDFETRLKSASVNTVNSIKCSFPCRKYALQ